MFGKKVFKKKPVLLKLLFLLTCSFISFAFMSEKVMAEDYWGAGQSECPHNRWKFVSDGRFYIHFIGENAAGGYTDSLGITQVNVWGLNGTQYHYADKPDVIYYHNPDGLHGLERASDRSATFVVSMCDLCGNPYYQGFSFPFYYSAPTAYQGGASSYSDGTLTTNEKAIYGSYRWPLKNIYYDNYHFPGTSSTLTKNYFVVSGTTTNDLGVQIRPASGIEYNSGSKTLVIRLQRTSYGLAIYPNGGTWNGYNYDTGWWQKWGTIKSIPNPTASPYTVILNYNNESGSTTRIASRTFSGWTKGGTGTLSGTDFIFGQGNSSLAANYNTSSVYLPVPTKTGYTCTGWYTWDGLKRGNVGSYYIPNMSEHLHAWWAPNTYYVDYHANGADGGWTYRSEHYYGTWKNLSGNGYWRNEYEFKGWNTQPDGTGTWYADGQNVANLTTINGGVVHLYAVWQNNLGVTATVTRMLAPHEPIFKMAETGVLTIHTTGFAEKVTVYFPSVLYPDGKYDQEYVLNSGAEFSDREIIFMIPLYCDEGEYSIEVTAYKGEQSMKVYPSLEIKGTVLDQLKTRIRS